MKRLAIVVQRCHKSVVGGSESLAWQYASALAQDYHVEILTTTATDIADWANVLPPGTETQDGLTIRRFTVTTGRSDYWHELHRRLADDFRKLQSADAGSFALLPWPLPLQEEFIRRQGPFSTPLIEFLDRESASYAAILFVTYLYPTTYFGMLRAPLERSVLVPTLHLEAPAFLSAYRHMARSARAVVWLSEAERQLGEKLWGALPYEIVPMAIKTNPAEAGVAHPPYLLYAGRVDVNKDCPALFEHFIEFKRQHPSPLQLRLVGKQQMPIPQHDDIRFAGFVSDEEKFRLMAGACALVMPSRRESFSIVTLEALAQKTPVLADAGSEVVAAHLHESGGGFTYHDYQTFAAALNRLLAGDLRADMGARGRAYVLAGFGIDRMRDGLVRLIESIPDPKST